MHIPSFPTRRPTTHALLLVSAFVTAPALAAEGCRVDAVGEAPLNCSAASTWNGQYDVGAVGVYNGASYQRNGPLHITNNNGAVPGGTSGTRGLAAFGQNLAATDVSRAAVTGDAVIDITVTNVFNATSNEGVRASLGAYVNVGGNLGVTTSTSGNAAYQARALVADGTGTGALQNTGSVISVDGSLAVDTTGAATTPVAIVARDSGRVVLHGGSVQSAMAGIWVLQSSAAAPDSVFNSLGAALLTVTAPGSALVLEGTNSASANMAVVDLDNAALTSQNAAALRLYNASGALAKVQYVQAGGSITATQGSAIAYTAAGGATGSASVTLTNTTVATQAAVPGGADADGVPMGYAVYSSSGSERNTLSLTGGSITGPIVADAGAKLSLELDSGAQWITGGDPAAGGANALSGIWGSGILRMSDIRDLITLRGDAPTIGAGCGSATLTLQVPPQAAPAASPYPVMVCNNPATHPAMALQGGSVVLGGFSYTLQTVVGGGQAVYQLVKGAAAPAGAGGATPVPGLGIWSLLLLSGLLAGAGYRAGRQRHTMKA